MDSHPRSWQQPFRTAQIVTAAMLGSLVLYGLLIQFLSANQPAQEPAPNATLFRYLFYGLAVSTLVAVRFLRSLVLATAMRDRPPEQRLLTAQILTGALIESAGLFGFVLYFVAGLKLDAFVLIALAIAMMALYFPRQTAWENYIAEQRRV